MKWSIIRHILWSEVRDQLRDRRTLLTMVLLPIAIYPLLATTLLPLMQLARNDPSRIYVVGSGNLPVSVPLLDDDGISRRFRDDEASRSLELVVAQRPDPVLIEALRRAETWDAACAESAEPPVWQVVIRRALRERHCDALLYVSPTARETVRRDGLDHRNSRKDARAASPAGATVEMRILADSTSEPSRLALARTERVLTLWRTALVESLLSAHDVPAAVVRPVRVVPTELSSAPGKTNAIWPKILPFAVMVWALTGAFHSATDLCAGEKERGTLETLLSSPASRAEIVTAKLLTVMAVSVVTSLLNMVSMGITGWLALGHLARLAPHAAPALGVPPWESMGWVLLGLLPLSAMFSAVALAIAAFARSNKEGQAYMLPVLLGSLPLMMLSMLPGQTLDLGTSLIPLTGMMFLLRALLEGEYAVALRYCLPALGVTLCCALLATRCAIRQFQQETILFRDGERFGLRAWCRRTFALRGDWPTFGQAILCAGFLLIAGFVMHMTFNSLTLLLTWIIPSSYASFAALQHVVRPVEGGFPYHYQWLTLGTMIGVCLLYWFARRPDENADGRPPVAARDRGQVRRLAERRTATVSSIPLPPAAPGSRP